MRRGCTASFVLGHLSHSTGSGIEREPFQEGVSWGPQRTGSLTTAEGWPKNMAVSSACGISRLHCAVSCLPGAISCSPHTWAACGFSATGFTLLRKLGFFVPSVPVYQLCRWSLTLCEQGMYGAILVILFLLELSLEGRSQDSCFLLGVLSLPSPFPSYICRTQCGDLLGQTEESWDSPGTNPCGCQ